MDGLLNNSTADCTVHGDITSAQPPNIAQIANYLLLTSDLHIKHFIQLHLVLELMNSKFNLVCLMFQRAIELEKIHLGIQ